VSDDDDDHFRIMTFDDARTSTDAHRAPRAHPAREQPFLLTCGMCKCARSRIASDHAAIEQAAALIGAVKPIPFMSKAKTRRTYGASGVLFCR